ncbi:hypothetical protein FOMPIDRAFT_99158 [Fomitopsis schrenkii]|uniref:Protein kinase domain-containing protein n=1 Tax=Fomitopsis schrenkii TaxID=2126942 RepID=S8EHE5_FOMSC|nr:hypothetical protein FOMPIDRAFT_99158 [Fomitopsis schrenkii]
MATIAGLTTLTVAIRHLVPWGKRWHEVRRERLARATLPKDLSAWSALDETEECQRVWETVRPAFDDTGIYLWAYDGVYSMAKPWQPVISSGFAYVTPVRGERYSGRFSELNCQNELSRGGTTSGGLNVVIRIVSMENEGRRHLEILRKLASGTRSLLTDNHVVPLWHEVQFDDLVFTVVPYVGYSMRECYGEWAKDSVGDIIDMILQALEAIAFVHDLGIVHRDLCKHNYLVQWHPESLTTMQVPLSRPRVFLTDFEMAYEFPPDVPSEQRLLTGLPDEEYRRRVAPEVASGLSYDPFKSDIWQFAESFSDFKATVPEIDAVLESMFAEQPSERLSAVDARDRLATVVHGMPPNSLLIPPYVTEDAF